MAQRYYIERWLRSSIRSALVDAGHRFNGERGVGTGNRLVSLRVTDNQLRFDHPFGRDAPGNRRVEQWVTGAARGWPPFRG